MVLPGDAGGESLWSFLRWVACDAGGTETRAMLPSLRENDSIASQFQESPKAPRKRFPDSRKGRVCWRNHVSTFEGLRRYQSTRGRYKRAVGEGHTYAG